MFSSFNTTTLWSRFSYCPRFTDEQTDAQVGRGVSELVRIQAQLLCPRFRLKGLQSESTNAQPSCRDGETGSGKVRGWEKPVLGTTPSESPLSSLRRGLPSPMTQSNGFTQDAEGLLNWRVGWLCPPACAGDPLSFRNFSSHLQGREGCMLVSRVMQLTYRAACPQLSHHGSLPSRALLGYSLL